MMSTAAGGATAGGKEVDTAGINIHKSNSCMRIIPSIIPDVYNGEAEWDEWIAHFDCVTRINGWDDDTHLLWLHV